MTLSYITDADRAAVLRLVESHPAAILVFTSPDCHWCSYLRPVLLDESRRHPPEILFADLTHCEEGVLDDYLITAFPTTVFFRNGRPVSRVRGFSGEAFYSRKISEFIASDARGDEH
jgi:thioredoxin-like negative regulator of GroEL